MYILSFGQYTVCMHKSILSGIRTDVSGMGGEHANEDTKDRSL